MLRLRGTEGIAAALLAAVIIAFLFNALLHSIVPHSHDGGEVIWQELHAAVRHEKQSVVVVTVAFTMLAAAVILVVSSPVLAFVPRMAESHLFVRGTHRSRKFR